jgi:hypothetical protein
MSELQQKLTSLFDYRDGSLYRKAGGRGAVRGAKLGHINSNGYEVITVSRKIMKTHQIVFVMHHGYMPNIIDHIDGNRLNNKIENLREVTRSENGYNRKIHKNNKTGYKNVTWISRISAYCVKLNVNKKRMHFGYFDDLELADLVATMAREKYHGKFLRN